jgi:hypothetical protein
LRREETAPVRAAHGFLVAADELRHLERRHQPVGQAAVLDRFVTDGWLVDASMLRLDGRLLRHRILPHVGAPIRIDADLME